MRLDSKEKGNGIEEEDRERLEGEETRERKRERRWAEVVLRGRE
jgi:hypothetical protein